MPGLIRSPIRPAIRRAIRSPLDYNYGGSTAAAPRGQVLYVSEGDSITAGTLNTSFTSYAKLWKNEFPGRVNFVNRAVSGSKIADLVSRAAATDALLASTATWSSSKILSVFVGTNESYGIDSPATFLASLASYCDARRTAGWKVVVATLLPRSDGGAAFETWRGTVNTGILAWVGAHCDATMNFGASVLMGYVAAAADTAKYIDGLHPTDLGQTYLYAVARPVLNGLTTATTPAAQYTTWNPSDKHANLTLSLSNSRVGSNIAPGTFFSVRSVAGRESGKYYTEFTVGGTNDVLVGVVDSAQALSTYFAYANSCVFYLPYYVFNTSMALVNAVGWTYVVGDKVGFAVDYDAGKLWIRKNGTYTSGSDPATGAAPNYTFPVNTMLWLGACLNATASYCDIPKTSGDFASGIPNGFLVY